jgi:hypothetical protein
MQPEPTGVKIVDDVLAEATGNGHRHDPVSPRLGGPAGNARLTSWTGLALLVCIAAELVTLLDVTGLMNWHVGVGIALVALALLKTASTGWRILRYYSRSAPYVSAGPPPLLLRVLGPLVIGSTFGVLGSGLALLAIGPRASETPWFALLGQEVSPVTIHQAFFVLFGVLVGLHLLARGLPAAMLATGRLRRGAAPRSVPGGTPRFIAVLATVAAAVVAIVMVVPSVHGWDRGRFGRDVGSLRDH